MIARGQEFTMPLRRINRNQVTELLLEVGSPLADGVFRCSHDPAGVGDAEMPRLALSTLDRFPFCVNGPDLGEVRRHCERVLAGPTREVERPARTRERDASAQSRRTERAGARRVGSESAEP